jgi:lipopolysaccharide transport system ATP-binding protein
MTTPAITINGLGKRYKLYRSPADKFCDVFGLNRLLFWRKVEHRSFWALRGLDLTIQQGERIGLIGRNGAGKSTLLKIISGSVGPTEGTLQVHGQVQALMELGTGFHPEFTGRENIRASLAYQGISVAAMPLAEAEIIDFSELDDFIDQPVKTYSAGMYARLAFATATYLKPEILIIDEILGAGDAYFAGKCIERMRRITEDSSSTVLFVSHDLSSVQRLCTRVLWIDRGRVRMQGDPLEVIKAYGDQVRREENLRLQARDLKLQKNQTARLRERLELYRPMLFHFVCDKAHPAGVHRVSKVRLLADGQEIGVIEIGQPMDNVVEQLHCVLDGPTMDWSQPLRFDGVWQRCYKNCNGQYQHAPFQFAVPRTVAETAANYTLEVEGYFDAKDTVFVERHTESGYVRVGQCAAGHFGGQSFGFASGNAEDAATPLLVSHASAAAVSAAPDAVSEYGDKKIILTQARLIDGFGQERRVFETGEKALVRLSYEAFQEIADPVFVFAVYLPDGQCAAQIWARASELGQHVVAGRGSVQFVIERLTLGRSAYVASAAIFADLRNDGMEAPAYHVLDRCIHFQVSQPLHEPFPEKGLSPQDFRTEMSA